MFEWSTYRPEDLLLFSPRTYWRLFEFANREAWPLQFLIFVLGALTVFWLFRPHRWSGRMIAGSMALAWASAGLFFIGSLYAPINWAITYIVPIFLAEAVLLVWFGVIRQQMHFRLERGLSSMVGFSLFTYALALHPLLALVAGRPIAAAEIVAIAPDPTAIASLGLLAMLPWSRAVGVMHVVPITWCAVSAVTLFTMGAREAWSLVTAIIVTLATCVLARSRRI